MDINIPLEQDCDYDNFHTKDLNDEYEECQGGMIYTSIPTKVCPKCRGTGRIPTDFGQELIDFVKRYT